MSTTNSQAEPEVSALRASIPSADAIGPEMRELLERHEREGVAHWHADRVGGATDEEVAASLNHVARYLAVPENKVASRLHGEAFILRDSANCTLRQFDCVTLSHVEPTRMERARAKGQLQLAALLTEAAEMLEGHAQAIEAGAGSASGGAGGCEPMHPDEEGWSEWIHPLPGYLMQCCDCGLIHEMQFNIAESHEGMGDGELNPGESTGGVVIFRARRFPAQGMQLREAGTAEGEALQPGRDSDAPNPRGSTQESEG